MNPDAGVILADYLLAARAGSASDGGHEVTTQHHPGRAR